MPCFISFVIFRVIFQCCFLGYSKCVYCLKIGVDFMLNYKFI